MGDTMNIYGLDKTIHSTNHIDVEVHNGKVVAVWFRCMPLEFKHHDVEADRAYEVEGLKGAIIQGIETADYLDKESR